MTSARKALEILNYLLEPANLRIDSLTAEKLETARLNHLDKQGHFQTPAFEVLPIFKSDKYKEILAALKNYQSDLDKLASATLNSVGYSFNNSFFTSPDSEVLYTVIREFKPHTILEVGCGNSTKVSRQAIIDGSLNTQIISIDPQPRTEITALVDRIYLQPLETLSSTDLELFSNLEAGDILFIDSSHALKTGNDVTLLYTYALHHLKPGVLIHIHDIFLPYDYPKDWIVKERFGWNEQYLVQSILALSNTFEILWAGYFLQHTLEDFCEYFPNLRASSAQSLWLRKTV